MKYYLNMPEIERLRKKCGISSISRLWRESGLDPNSFFKNQRVNCGRPIATLETVYRLSRRLECGMEQMFFSDSEF